MERILTSKTGLVVFLLAAHCCADIEKNASPDNLELDTSWTGEAVPGTGDVALWNVASSCTNTISGAVTWKGIKISDPLSDVVITNTLSYSSAPNFAIQGDGTAGSGFDLSNAGVNCSIVGVNANNAILFKGSNFLSVAQNRTLSFNGNNIVAYVHKGASNKTIINGAGIVSLGGTFQVGELASIDINSGIVTNGILSANGSTTQPGYINQSGGTVYSTIYVAQTANYYGQYNLSGGIIALGDIYVSYNGIGTMLVTGNGTISQANRLVLAYYGVGSKARFIQTDSAEVRVSRLSMPGHATVSTSTTADLIISNGVFVATTWDNLAVANSSTGRVWLAGGVTTLPAFPTTRGTGAYAELNMDGGTLKPYANSAAYMGGLDHAYVTSRGAVFDTDGWNVTVSQVLENAAGQSGKLIKKGAGELTLSAPNTYTGETIVSNGVLKLTLNNALSSESTVRIVSSAGATNILDFSGTNTINKLYIDDVLQPKNKLFGANTMNGAIDLSPALSGSGYYYTLDGDESRRGTVVLVH